MQKSNLILHCGARFVERDEVFALETPEGTNTHQPIPHSRLIKELETVLPTYNLRVEHESHGVSKDNNRYFGLFQLSNCTNKEDYSLVFGLRNSHDKKFPAGLLLGSSVFVCDNLAFSSEVKVARRHTRFILRDLPALVSKAVSKLVNVRNRQDERFDAYKKYELTNSEAHDIVVQAMRQKIVKPTRVPKVVEQWHQPNHPEFSGRTAWRLFNAFTEAYKGSPLHTLPERTTRLHGMLDQVVGLAV